MFKKHVSVFEEHRAGYIPSSIQYPREHRGVCPHTPGCTAFTINVQEKLLAKLSSLATSAALKDDTMFAIEVYSRIEGEAASTIL